MIVNTNVVAFKQITSKAGDRLLKVWVTTPPNGCEGTPVESTVIARPDHDVQVGDKCIVSVDRFGRLNDVQL